MRPGRGLTGKGAPRGTTGQAEVVRPDQCPTCRARDPQTCRYLAGDPMPHPHARYFGGAGCCPDPFHDG